MSGSQLLIDVGLIAALLEAIGGLFEALWPASPKKRVIVPLIALAVIFGLGQIDAALPLLPAVAQAQFVALISSIRLWLSVMGYLTTSARLVSIPYIARDAQAESFRSQAASPLPRGPMNTDQVGHGGPRLGDHILRRTFPWL